MSELIDRIPGQESAVARLRGVVNTTAQLKARQRLTGRSGQLGYAVDSGLPFDYAGSVAYTNSSFEIAQFHVIFEGDGTQRFPIAVPQLDVRINGTGSGNRMVFVADTSQYEYEDSVVEIMAFAYGKPVESFFEDENKLVWLINLFFIGKTGSGNFSINIKPRAQSSCNGTFSVVRLS